MFLLVPRVASTPSRPKEPIDWVGGALALIGVAAVLTGVALGDEYGWWDARKPFRFLGVWQPPLSITAILVLGGVVLLGVWAFERRTRFGRSRAQPFRAGSFRNRGFVATVSTSALHSLAIGGMMFSLFVFVPFVFKLGSLLTSIVVLPYSVATVVAAVLAPQLARRVPPRHLLQGGLLLAGAGVVVLIALISRVVSPLALLPGLLIAGLGSGFVFQQIPQLVLASTGDEPTSEGPGISTSMQMLGGSMGTALLGALLMVSAATFIVDGVTRELGATVTPERRSEAADTLSESLRTFTKDEMRQALASLPAPVQEALDDTGRQAAVDAMRVTLLAIAGFLVVATAVSVLTPRGRRVG